MLQTTLVVLFFLVAVAYVARLGWRAFAAKPSGAGCAKGCGGCDAATDVQRKLAAVPVRGK